MRGDGNKNKCLLFICVEPKSISGEMSFDYTEYQCVYLSNQQAAQISIWICDPLDNIL